MGKSDKIFVGRWIKKNGRLEFHRGVNKSLFDSLVGQMRENQVIDFMVDFSNDDGSLAQIAKLKAGIRELARETGHHNIEIENEIKKNAGLYDEINKVHKSFAYCSNEELGAAIHVMIEFGVVVGLKLDK